MRDGAWLTPHSVSQVTHSPADSNHRVKRSHEASRICTISDYCI